METKKIIVTGKVQRVFFRQSAGQKARELLITGTIKNLPDGQTVEIIATAAHHQLLELINWCRQGPPNAMVENIEVLDLSLTKFDNFSII